MGKVHQSLITLLLISSMAFLFSCQGRYTSIKFVANKKRVYQGEEVLVRWRINGKTRKITKMSLNDRPVPVSTRFDSTFTFEHDTVLVLKVWVKNHSKPFIRKRKIRVRQMGINGFLVYRDRFNPNKVFISWDVTGAKRIKITNLGDDLASIGKDSIYTGSSKLFELIAMNEYDTLFEIRSVEPAGDMRPLIIGDKAIETVVEGEKIKMDITEINTELYPDVVSMRVLAFDSVGHFITNLAPPYGDSATAKKYFKRLTQKIGSSIEDVDFSVQEFREQPRIYDLSLVLDYSGSMEMNIDFLETATEIFINKKHAEDRYAIVKFDEHIKTYGKLTSNQKKIIRDARFYGMQDFGGSAAMYAAINVGASQLYDDSHEKMIILFTDGYENSSMRYLNEYSVFINQVIDTVKAYDARLVIIGLGDVNDVLLRELTYYTNGSFYHLQRVEDISAVYYEINHNLRTYYEITFKPKIGSGENMVELEYFNNQSVVSTQRPFFSGNNYEITKYEIDSNAYWYEPDLVAKHYQLITSPQTLVNFELNKSQIDPSFHKSLNNIVKLMKRDPGMIIRIYGHTDTRGTEEANMELSNRRIKAVFQYLVKHGIRPGRIRTKAFGETQPIYPDDKEEWKAQENRRVEFSIWKKAVPANVSSR